MTDQYARTDYSGADGTPSPALWEECKALYDAETSKPIGKGKAVRHFFAHARLCVNPADIFADLAEHDCAPVNLKWEQYRRIRVYDAATEAMKEAGAFFADCDFGHAMPDWATVMRDGIPGVIARCDAYLAAEAEPEKRDFYTGVRLAYEGILLYTDRLRRLAEATPGENAAFAAANLAALCRHAPQTLAEAMQLYFLYYTAEHFVDGDNLRSLGALDDILYPYYSRDLEAGTLTEEQVRELMRYFLYKWTTMKQTANIPFNLCTHTNDLTYLILEEYIALDVIDPKIHIKCKPTTPTRIYEMVMDSIRHGKNSFVFVNDAVVRRALEGIGETPVDAENYTLVGCYEPAAVGKEVPCSCSGRLNMPMALETVLGGGVTFGGAAIGRACAPAGFADFGALLDAVKAQLADWIDAMVADINGIERHYGEMFQAPVMSASYDCCMERGRDAYDGGVPYPNTSISAFGIATLVDALTAIRHAVYEDRIVSLPELTEVLRADWADAASLRRQMLAYPKYGNGLSEPDGLAAELIAFLAEKINRRPNGRGGVYRLGLFSIDWRMAFGKKLGATADGRAAGEPVSKNMCAGVGMDKAGVTGLINTVTTFDYSLVPDGTVTDITLHPSAIAGDEGLHVMVSLLKVFLAKGGNATHINAMDADTLCAAQQRPDEYRHLQVRLCGWNVYFNDLDRAGQDDLIRSMT